MLVVIELPTKSSFFFVFRIKMIFILLAFCLMQICMANAKSNCSADTAAQKVIGSPLKKVSMKTPYNESGENVEIKQFVRELIDHYSMIEAVLYSDQVTTDWQKLNSNTDELVDGIKKIDLELDKKEKNESSVKQSLIEKFGILKSIDQLDKQTTDLLHKLHKAISDLTNSNDEEQSAKFQNLKKEIVEAVIMLANDWDISVNEIMPLENRQKIDQKSILEELATLWHQFESEEGDDSDQNSEENRQNGQRNKRMLQLIMDFSSDGIDGLANLKSQKKRQSKRRRRKRSVGSTVGVLIGGLIFCVVAIWAVRHYGTDKASSADIETGSHDVPGIVPEPRESAKPRRQRKNHGNTARVSNTLDQEYYNPHHVEHQDWVPPRDSMYYADGEYHVHNGHH